MASQYAGWAISAGGLLRDGLGAAARQRACREGAVREARLTRRTPRTASSCSRPARCHRRVARLGGRKGAAGAGRRSPSRSRRPRALPAACRSSARVIETGLHKMEILGFDVRTRDVVRWARRRSRRRREATRVRSAGPTTAFSTADRPATWCSGATASWPSVEALPASASSDYGTPFYDIFKRYDNDFYKIDPLLFSPGGSLAHQRDERPHVPRRASQPRGAAASLLPEATCRSSS